MPDPAILYIVVIACGLFTVTQLYNIVVVDNVAMVPDIVLLLCCCGCASPGA